MKIRIRYFASLREKAGVEIEEIETNASTVRELYKERKYIHGFTLEDSLIKASVDAEFISLDSRLEENMTLVLMPPVAGG